MSEMGFFHMARTLTAAQAADLCSGTILNEKLGDLPVSSLRSLENAKPGALIFADGAGKSEILASLPSCTLICTEQLAGFADAGKVAIIIVKKPQHAFAKIGRFLFPDSVRTRTFSGSTGISGAAHIASSAVMETDVTIEAAAVVGHHVEIGSGTLIGAGALIGEGVRIGRNCVIGPGASLTHAFLGNNVIVHAGVRIGQDGFGYVAGPEGLEKVPQLGRVIIQDKVEIGANTTVDRGALDDTVIGEGTKIDNLVQIAHNCRIGRYCVITGHCGLSGSVTLGDGVMLGGRVGIADHVSIGDGAQVAAASGVMTDIPAGQRWAGLPAQPMKEFFREVAIIRGLARQKKDKRDDN